MTLKIEIKNKPKFEKVATSIDFYKLFQIVEKTYKTCFLLESLRDEDPDSRYSLIGFEPDKIICAKGNKLFVDNQEFEVENPYQELAKNFPNPIDSNQSYAGGLIGYMGYECMNYFEPSLKLEEHKNFANFCFGLYFDGLILDRMTDEVTYYYYENSRLDEVKKLLKELENDFENIRPEVKFLGDTSDKKEHKKVVLDTVDEIKKGNIFQAEVGFRTEFEIKGDTMPIYTELREVNPSPYMYYLKFGDKKMIGASPELLFKVEDGVMETYPLAGTVKRGETETKDRSLARELLNNPKEIAEHNMLVDLHRNDLGRVAKFGTVKVKRLMDIKKFSHVQHISSEIIGVMHSKENMFSALASNFPAGTLSGAPKIEAIKIIARNEGRPRGPYGGAVGSFGFSGDCTFCIPIRSLFVDGNKAFAQTSGGIVYDSKPDEEYQEIVNKLAAMKKVLEKFKV